MAVSISYSGKLVEGKTVDDVVSHIEAIAQTEGLRSQRPGELYGKGQFRFHIPQQAIDNPDIFHWGYSNRTRISEYAQAARLPTKGKSYEDLCEALNSTVFTQVGVYLWVHEQAEPLRFLFVEGDTELTRLVEDSLQDDRFSGLSIQYVDFQRMLTTKTGYERNPRYHRRALGILRNVNSLYFGEKMRIVDPD